MHAERRKNSASTIVSLRFSGKTTLEFEFLYIMRTRTGAISSLWNNKASTFLYRTLYDMKMGITVHGSSTSLQKNNKQLNCLFLVPKIIL